MTELIELNANLHGSLRLVKERLSDEIRSRHILNLRVNEVAQAATCFPTFISRSEPLGHWALSAVSGLETGKNLFVDDGQWSAIYQPSSVRTHPFYLMKAADDETSFNVGFDPQSTALSEEEGEPLFDEPNKASLYLSEVTAMLNSSLKGDVHTHQFIKLLSDLNLIKSINVLVEYEDGAINTIKGLHTIDEDKLQALSKDDFEQLRDKGYLAPVYALLISIFQLNSLLQKHNISGDTLRMKQIKLEVPKSFADL